MSTIHVFRSCLRVPIKSSAAGPDRPASEEKHHFPAHKCLFLVPSLVLQRWSWGRKAVNHDRAAHAHVRLRAFNVVTQHLGGDSCHGGVEQVVSRHVFGLKGQPSEASGSGVH